jgi:ABC-type bacteriocin/lantibiotic exporter with double-glycine peptidase domain
MTKFQRVVVLKDEYNRKAHEESAQLACEAAGAIRTVASLAREDNCCEIYSESLEEPLRASNKTALSSDLFYATSQAMSFWVIALIFWYGSILVSRQEISTFKFFVSLMVCKLANAVIHPYLTFLTLLVEHYFWFYPSRQRFLICSGYLVCQWCCYEDR